MSDTNSTIDLLLLAQQISWGTILLRSLAVLLFIIALTYALGALVFWHSPSPWIRGILVAVTLVNIYLLCHPGAPDCLCVIFPNLWMRLLVIAGWIAIVLGLHTLRRPRKGKWIAPQKKVASVSFDGDHITIDNFRFSKRNKHKGSKAEQVDWQQHECKISDIVGVDLIIKQFANWKGSAHAMCSFRMKNGSNIAVSVESRRELPKFSPAGGLYRYYHLIFIFGDERDLLWSRIISDTLYPMVIYPLDVTEQQAQDFFRNLAERANQLSKQPEFYHVLDKNCLTTLVNASPDLCENLVTDYRFFFPGFSHEIFSEIGLIKGDLEQLMQKYAVSNDTPAPDFKGDGRAWSDMIRSGSL